MKKLLLFLFVVHGFCAFAQKSFFGVDAGINVANQRTVSQISYNGGPSIINGVSFHFNKVQPTFGFFYHFGLSETCGIRVNAQYMGLGYKAKDVGTDVDINYLTFPVTFHYNVTKHLSFNSGAYVSFTLGGTKINGEDITKTYHKNDYGISIGGEYDLSKKISLSASYIIGLKNIWLEDKTVDPVIGYTIISKYTNRALQFTLIYKFKKTN
jgi:long-subunit fatty acid transport protein